MPKWLSIFDTEGLSSKMLFYQLKISVFWHIFAMVKNVLDRCDDKYKSLIIPNYALEMNCKKIMLHISFSTQFSVLNAAKAASAD